MQKTYHLVVLMPFFDHTFETFFTNHKSICLVAMIGLTFELFLSTTFAVVSKPLLTHCRSKLFFIF